MITNHTAHSLALAAACVLESYLVVLVGLLLAELSTMIGCALFTDVNTILFLGVLLFTGTCSLWMVCLISKGLESVILTEFPLYIYGPFYLISLTVENAFSWVPTIDMLLYCFLPLGVGLFRIAMLLALRLEEKLTVEIGDEGITFTTKKEMKKILWSEIETVLFSGVLVLRGGQPRSGALGFWRPFRQQLDFCLYAYPFFFDTKREMMKRLERRIRVAETK